MRKSYASWYFMSTENSNGITQVWQNVALLQVQTTAGPARGARREGELNARRLLVPCGFCRLGWRGFRVLAGFHRILAEDLATWVLLCLRLRMPGRGLHAHSENGK